MSITCCCRELRSCIYEACTAMEKKKEWNWKMIMQERSINSCNMSVMYKIKLGPRMYCTLLIFHHKDDAMPRFSFWQSINCAQLTKKIFKCMDFLHTWLQNNILLRPIFLLKSHSVQKS
jgi:hypothetical protein